MPKENVVFENGVPQPGSEAAPLALDASAFAVSLFEMAARSARKLESELLSSLSSLDFYGQADSPQQLPSPDFDRPAKNRRRRSADKEKAAMAIINDPVQWTKFREDLARREIYTHSGVEEILTMALAARISEMRAIRESQKELDQNETDLHRNIYW
eukprot:CAMPEP_0197435656 /NCGR_PEP_ID=MMETSP1175-20131217/3222_1 /TAXON_ID=1003142 /ORGANISM="Triceratium dubium, Strain CCMP147" /LENGTH=156 /DNA_ID=CAMNT_0042964753 /DNA_START=147 /DNA_END=614 /DNA_ORIENTATION=+